MVGAIFDLNYLSYFSNFGKVEADKIAKKQSGNNIVGHPVS